MSRRSRRQRMLVVAVPLLLVAFLAWAVSMVLDPPRTTRGPGPGDQMATDAERAGGVNRDGGNDPDSPVDADGGGESDGDGGASGPVAGAGEGDGEAGSSTPTTPVPGPGPEPGDPAAAPGDRPAPGAGRGDPNARDPNARGNRRRPGRARSNGPFRRPEVRDNLFRGRTRKLNAGGASPPDSTDSDGPVGLLGTYHEAPETMRDHGAAFPDDATYASVPIRFARLDPRVHFMDGASAFTEPGQPLPEKLLVRWDGYLNVREAGEYAFFVGCTGLAELYISGDQVYRRGTHVFYEDFVRIELPAGLLPFRMQWFHYRRDPQVQLRYYLPHDLAVLRAAETAPDDTIEHTAVEGDTAASLAEQYYGVPDHADLLVEANPALVADDQPIEPGTLVTVPPLPLSRLPFAPVVVPETFFRPPPNAFPPTLDSITPAKAAVGDEVILRGRDFGNAAEVRVEFAGRATTPLDGDATTLRVIVPIGATTGDVIVRQGPMQSNALPFACSTVFGLLGGWFDQADETPAYVEDNREPDEVLVGPVNWTQRSEIPSSLRHAPFAVRLTGDLGVPESGLYKLVLTADEAARLTLDHVELAESRGGIAASAELYLEIGRHPIRLEAIDSGGPATLQLAWQRLDGANPDVTPVAVAAPFFFAPDVGRPPEILEVVNLPEFGPAEGESVQLVLAGVGENMTAFVDGIAAQLELINTEDAIVRVTIPPGVGAGQVTIRRDYLTSAPVTIPIRNVGLLGRYYDFPESGFPTGWPPGFPDDRPISFMRQDREVDFDGTGAFDLPFSETFGATWHGTIRIDEPGVYRFWLGGDDGMAMYIGEAGAVFTLDDGGALHAYLEINGEVELQPGTYPIMLKYWENRGADILRMFWQRPGATVREIVPRRVLRMPADWLQRYDEWRTALDDPPGGEGETPENQ